MASQQEVSAVAPQQQGVAVKEDKKPPLSPLERKLLALKAKRDEYRLCILRINSHIRVLTEKARSVERRQKRAELKGAPGHAVGAKKKYLGHCLACVYRAAGWAGGSKHHTSRCGDAQKFFATPAGKRWLKKIKADKAKKVTAAGQGRT